MKALTIHQPFASAIGHEQLDAPRKNYEIRPDPTKYRGPVLIHAGKRPPLNAYELNLGAVAVMGPGTPVRTYEEALYSGFVAIARIADCEFVTEAKGPTSRVLIRIGCKTTEALADGWRIIGRYAWRLEDIRPLPWVPYAPGFLGFWAVEAARLGEHRETYEAAWNELEGRSVACAS